MEQEEKRAGAPVGNKNAKKGKYPRRVVSLSGPEFDRVIDAFRAVGVNDPTNEQILQVLLSIPDGDKYPFITALGAASRSLTPQQQAQIDQRRAEKHELAIIRADYQYTVMCQRMPLEELRRWVQAGIEDIEWVREKLAKGQADEDELRHYQKRQWQALIVLEAREKEEVEGQR